MQGLGTLLQNSGPHMKLLMARQPYMLRALLNGVMEQPKADVTLLTTRFSPAKLKQAHEQYMYSLCHTTHHCCGVALAYLAQENATRPYVAKHEAQLIEVATTGTSKVSQLASSILRFLS